MMMEIMTVQRSSYNKNIVVIVMTVVSKRMMLMVMLVTSIMLQMCRYDSDRFRIDSDITDDNEN